jgi:hypothetical protein
MKSHSRNKRSFKTSTPDNSESDVHLPLLFSDLTHDNVL